MLETLFVFIAVDPACNFFFPSPSNVSNPWRSLLKGAPPIKN